MAETPVAAHDGAVVTDASELFIVHHYDPPPVGAPDLGHVLMRSIAGTETQITEADVRGLPAREVTAVLECAGNGRKYLEIKAPGTQFGHGLCGVATWRGVSLRDLLEANDARGEFATVVVRGLDAGWAAPENLFSDFAKGLPCEKALHPDTLLAWELNGEPVPHEHGGPLRLVVPGWAGVWWVKWVTEITCTNDSFHGFWQNQRYRYVGGEYPEPQVVMEQLPRALITSPVAGEYVSSTTTVRGKAWSGAGPISRVEVSVDGGASWLDAGVAEPEGPWMWVDWTLDVELPAHAALICARATDATGARQEWTSRQNRLGYGNNGIGPIQVSVSDART
jgi:DMSO/TMAO reductase YedYZ molybdopterin-dependent catalytic subunit